MKKSKSKKTQPAPEQEPELEIWITIPQAAWLCGLSEGSFKNAYRPLLPKGRAHVRKQGQRVILNAQSVVAVFAEKKAEETRATVPKRGGEGQEMMSPAAQPTPYLEEYRKEQFLLARVKRLEYQKQLVHLDSLHDDLMRMGQAIRTCGTILEREYGRGARLVVEDAMKTFMEEVKRTCGKRQDELIYGTAKNEPGRGAGAPVAGPDVLRSGGEVSEDHTSR